MTNLRKLLWLRRKFDLSVPYPVEECFLRLENHNQSRTSWYTALSRPIINVVRVKYRTEYDIAIQQESIFKVPIYLNAQMYSINSETTLIRGVMRVKILELIRLVGALFIVISILFSTLISVVLFLLLAVLYLVAWDVHYSFDELNNSLEKAITPKK